MEKQLSMIVKFEVKKDKIQFVKSELLKLLEPTRKENGCVFYELHQDLEDPSIFMFYEIWETTSHWEAHNAQPNLVSFKKAIEGSIEKLTFNKLSVL